MTQSEILNNVNGIARAVFDDGGLELSDLTTAKDLPGWDPLTHVDLSLAAEKGFNISLTAKEAMTLANIGDLSRLSARRSP
jgi:acyl carrier protein